jgi:hypothetical protein
MFNVSAYTMKLRREQWKITAATVKSYRDLPEFRNEPAVAMHITHTEMNPLKLYYNIGIAVPLST